MTTATINGATFAQQQARARHHGAGAGRRPDRRRRRPTRSRCRTRRSPTTACMRASSSRGDGEPHVPAAQQRLGGRADDDAATRRSGRATPSTSSAPRRRRRHDPRAASRATASAARHCAGSGSAHRQRDPRVHPGQDRGDAADTTRNIDPPDAAGARHRHPVRRPAGRLTARVRTTSPSPTTTSTRRTSTGFPASAIYVAADSQGGGTVTVRTDIRGNTVARGRGHRLAADVPRARRGRGARPCASSSTRRRRARTRRRS